MTRPPDPVSVWIYLVKVLTVKESHNASVSYVMLRNLLVSKNPKFRFHGFLLLFFTLRANSGSNSVREHRFEICESGLELHPWARSRDVSQRPRGNVPRNARISVTFFMSTYSMNWLCKCVYLQFGC